MFRIQILPGKLYEGCLLAAIAHAVTVGEYPELNYEHTWDGINYCLNNSCGCRGTITFHHKYIVAAFRDETKVDLCKNALDYFDGASEEIKALADTETLQYLLDDVDGVIKPLITAALWGTWTELFSNDPLELFLENCSDIIKIQLMDFPDAMQAWDDNYEFHDGQDAFIRLLFCKKTCCKDNHPIILAKDEAADLYGDIDECTESLRELNILL